jgi:hypothetical protein
MEEFQLAWEVHHLKLKIKSFSRPLVEAKKVFQH